MHPAFQHQSYTLKRKILSLANRYTITSPGGETKLFSQQKMFRLKEDIRIYEDESKTRELLLIKAKQVIDFAAAYDVIDAVSGQHVGILRRKGFSSMVRDRWQVLNPAGQLNGYIEEDSMGLALLRRFLLGSLLPQRYTAVIADSPAAEFQQKFHLLRYQMDIHLLDNTISGLDTRLALAASILLAAIEGKQS